ncbi:hypothetical protein PSTEL_18680 [Paenibacillus stellifer]|uniref:Uncharacterized protein n=1 Tax=Paenibacillus stellifer TaxID=169760 RepID=A0A089LVB1_9BACL|nr:DUF6171 family protein [Paenibacillus stellifer]AIQ64837.1 hypothetical protein PSTEL_18680 [Paenibacillus stellifer]
MTKGSSCKACRDEYRVTDEQIARILAAPMFASEHCVPEQVYQERLEACRACPKLEGGITCRVCGCIIPVVAKLKERSCPLPGGSRWQAQAVHAES